MPPMLQMYHNQVCSLARKKLAFSERVRTTAGLAVIRCPSDDTKSTQHAPNSLGLAKIREGYRSTSAWRKIR